MGKIAVVMAVLVGLGPAWALAQEPLQLAPLDGEAEQAINMNLRVGQPFAYSLCLGRDVTIPAPGDASQHLNPALSPCGDSQNPSPNVSGDNPPYHFTLDTMGGFPPIGISLDMNGILRGTPHGTLPATFRVCAVDMSANTSCQTITLQPQPAIKAAATPRKKGGNTGLIVAALLIGAAGIAAGAVALSKAATLTQASGAVNGRCFGLAAANACGSCTCPNTGDIQNVCHTAQCGGDACYYDTNLTVQQAPFCQ